MDFQNAPTGDGGSYEKPNAGKYMGVLVGFAFIGTQPGGQYGPKPRVMLRWELHKRKGPSLDSANNPHTITQRFGATIRGDNSLLRKAIEAHMGRSIAEGETVRSQDWLSLAAWLDIEHSDDGKYANVTSISRLDPEDDEAPKPILSLEHWEKAEDGPPPGWARWAIERSTDLAHLVKGANGAPARKPQTVPPEGDDDDDTPF